MIAQSTINCPSCGASKTETMPTDACQYLRIYRLRHALAPKEGRLPRVLFLRISSLPACVRSRRTLGSAIPRSSDARDSVTDRVDHDQGASLSSGTIYAVDYAAGSRIAAVTLIRKVTGRHPPRRRCGIWHIALQLLYLLVGGIISPRMNGIYARITIDDDALG